MSDVTSELLESLAAKLDSLDLTAEEQQVLDTIFERAETGGDDVEGFAFSAGSYAGFKSGADLSRTALKIGGGLGFVTRPSLGYDDPFDPTRGGGGGPGKPPPP